MNDRNETMIDAVIKKAEALCPDSLALIGVYGSVATGDEYGSFRQRQWKRYGQN